MCRTSIVSLMPSILCVPTVPPNTPSPLCLSREVNEINKKHIQDSVNLLRKVTVFHIFQIKPSLKVEAHLSLRCFDVTDIKVLWGKLIEATFYEGIYRIHTF